MNRRNSTAGRGLRQLAGLGSLALLAACSLTPYQRPALDVPAQWQTGSAQGSNAAGPWWQRFGDAQLNTLIDAALRANNDLVAAGLRVRRARLQAGLADVATNPTLAASLSTNVTRNLNTDRDTKSSSASASLALEPDLWGKFAGSRMAAQLEAEASQADCRGAALQVAATTATLYWKIAFLNDQLAANEANVANAAKVLDFVRVKHDAGKVSGLDVAQAEQNLAQIQATGVTYGQQRTEARNALTILFDRAPGHPSAERPRLADDALPRVDTGLPATLLGRRPDVRAAELRLRGALASADATRANMYPSFSLTGSAGSSSTELKNVLKNPTATLGIGLALPFLNWNTMQLNVAVSENQYEEAVVNFRQKLYTAMREVEDALSARSSLMSEAEKLTVATAQARRAEALSAVRYRAGATALQLWLDAQDKLRNAEIALAQNRLNQLNNYVKLVQALGGDGDPAAPGCLSAAAGTAQ
ncbi:MAG TPA: efflux transporter outer membrane subunit [Azospira sp.]|nr:efflux transporter outer membrane subunit [Azospira sp.]